MGFKYRIIGSRNLRKYIGRISEPSYMAEAQAQKIANTFCEIPWEPVSEKSAMTTYHTDAVIDDTTGETGFDANVRLQDSFDAAAFCADHVGGMHKVYANAAVYKYKIPTGDVGKTLQSISVNTTSDPYNAQGVRLHIITNDDGVIPMGCHTLRGENSEGQVIQDGTTAQAVAIRTVRTVDGTDYWYPTVETAVITPTSSFVLGQYLLLVVAKESYSAVRGNWIEGSSFITNDVEIELDSESTSLSPDKPTDLSNDYSIIFKCPDHGYSGIVIGSAKSKNIRVFKDMRVIAFPSSVFASIGDVAEKSFSDCSNFSLYFAKVTGRDGYPSTQLFSVNQNLKDISPKFYDYVSNRAEEIESLTIAHSVATQSTPTGTISILAGLKKSSAVCSVGFTIEYSISNGVASYVSSSTMENDKWNDIKTNSVAKFYYTYTYGNNNHGAQIPIAKDSIFHYDTPPYHAEKLNVRRIPIGGGDLLYFVNRSRTMPGEITKSIAFGTFTSIAGVQVEKGIVIIDSSMDATDPIKAVFPLELDSYEKLKCDIGYSEFASSRSVYAVISGNFRMANGVSCPDGGAIIYIRHDINTNNPEEYSIVNTIVPVSGLGNAINFFIDNSAPCTYSSVHIV